jgi:hypothetical protein
MTRQVIGNSDKTRLGWLGPDWFANLASFLFFGLFAFWFDRRVRA